jgi:hypothetical protein
LFLPPASGGVRAREVTHGIGYTPNACEVRPCVRIPGGGGDMPFIPAGWYRGRGTGVTIHRHVPCRWMIRAVAIG